MKLWLIEMDFLSSDRRTYNIRYFVEMTDGYARRVKNALARAKAPKPSKMDDLVAFDVEPVADLVYGLDEFVAEVDDNHPGLLAMMGKRWNPEAE